jgi:hypothetical protein
VGGVNSGFVTTLEVFYRYTGNSQALVSSLISGITNDGAGKSKVVNQTTGAVIRSSATLQPTTGTGRYVFSTVKNRLYMANGTDIPAISADATANSTIPWGFSPQTPALTYQIAAPGTGTNALILGGTQGTCNTTNAVNSVVTWVSGPNFEYFKTGQTIYINGVFATIAVWSSATQVVLDRNLGALGGVPFSYAPTGLSGVVGDAATNLNTGNGAFTTWTGAALNAGSVIIGDPMYLSTGGFGAGFVPTVKYSLTSIGGAANGTFSPVLAEAAVVNAKRQAQINFGPMTFENGSYQYGVSYFNTTSGHVTNLSPILAVKDGAPNNANVTVTISNIIATNDPNYTKIILWRSARGGSNLFPLTILNNNTGNAAGSTITYTDILGDDTALGTATNGPGKVVAPRGENAPPPADLNLIAYWQGRFWGVSQTQIGLLFFSARSAGNNEDISVGVPEECWPLNFTRAIPESDGRITGLRTVGDNLFVLTDNSIYAVVGSTKDDYGLSKVSSKGKGTAHFATCVIPGEDVNSTDVMVHFGNDGRLYFLFGSGGDFCVSYALQDRFDGLGATSANVNLGTIHTSVSTFIMVGIGTSALYLYDIERKIWTISPPIDGVAGFGPTAYVEGLFNGTVTQFYGNGVTVFKGNQNTGTPPAYTVLTNFTPFVTEDRKGNKTLQSLTVYTNENAANISALAFIDQSSTPITLTQVPASGSYAAAYHEYPDAVMFVPQVVAAGRLFQFQVTVTPSAFFNYGSATYEIMAAAAYEQSDEAKGANL